MRHLELTETARADLKSIGRYSIREWGAERTAHYMTALSDVMKRLVAGTSVSREREDLRPGLRMATSGRHCIFFEEDSLRILVIRVLHDRMDHHSHFDVGQPNRE